MSTNGAYRELDDALGLSTMAGEMLADSRTGKNGRHALVNAPDPCDCGFGDELFGLLSAAWSRCAPRQALCNPTRGWPPVVIEKFAVSASGQAVSIECKAALVDYSANF